MRPHQRPSSLLLVIVITVAAAAVAAQETKYKAPRTESGHPDLQGVWNFDSGVPLERPPGAVDVSRQTHKGTSVRVIPVYDGVNDESAWRLDVLYGVKAIDPRLAVRLSGTS